MRNARLVTALAWGLPMLAAAQSNLGFEAGAKDWSFQAGTAELSSTVARTGEHSLELRPSDRELARLEQTVPASALDGDRVVIEAFLKTALEEGAVASLWVRVDGEQGLLYVDRAVESGARGVSDWAPYRVTAPLTGGARVIRLGVELRGAGTAWVDDFRIAPRRASELPALSPGLVRYVERGLDIMAANSIRRHEIDWPALRASVLEQARGDNELSTALLALRVGLTALGDGHSYLMTAAQMKALSEAPAANARRGGTPAKPHATLLDGGTGYLRVPGFAGGTQQDQVEFAERLQNQLADLDRAGACRFVVDLRGNRGGNLWPMLAGVGPLLADGELAAAVYPDGQRRSVWYREGKAGLDEAVQLRVRGEPYRLRAPASGVAVLTDGATASAAEMLLIALRNSGPAARSFGAPTSGATTGTKIFELGDGAAIVLAVAATLDARGRAYLGPIEPDEAVETDARTSPLEAQPAVTAAERWLASLAACAEPPAG